MTPKISVCIASRNHAPLLRRTLDSIFQQGVEGLEVIVTDDGSTDDTPAVLDHYAVKRLRLESSEYRNGVLAKNSSLRAAAGDIIVQQSDDVIHATPNLIETLANALEPGRFCIAPVHDWNTETGQVLKAYTGIDNMRPLFFLGACWREDVCKIGGYDPEFAKVIWYDDNWHADGLIRGLGLTWTCPPVLGLHQAHARPDYDWSPATTLYKRKCADAEAGRDSWFSSAGPWTYIPGKAVCDVESA